jgi:hypothetical protein
MEFGKPLQRTQLSIWNVGAIIDRPWIFRRKIHRRKAKGRLFSCGKSEKLRFSAGDQ